MHTHRLEEVEGGTKMTDDIIYQVPFRIFGSIAHVPFVRRTLERIFRYRRKSEEIFQINNSLTSACFRQALIMIRSFLNSFMTQKWEDLVMAHYPAQPELIQSSFTR